MYKFRVKTLANGLRILLVPSHNSLSVQVMALVNTGSDFETKNINGISHFLEHMCFKGTKKRPSSMAIAQELDDVGGAYNAFTSQEFTGYYVRVAKDKIELALDIVSDIYINSQFSEESIKRERGVILEEMNMIEDEPAMLIENYWLRLLYGNQPAGWPVIGSKTNVRRFKRNDFLRYHQLHYRTRSTLLVISGNFQEKVVISYIKKYFSSLRTGKGKPRVPVHQLQNRPQLFWKKKQTNQSHLLFGFRAGNIFDPRRYALTVVNTVLSGGMSARLWQRIREELGAAYYLRSSVDLFTDYGFWVVKAGIDNNRVEAVIKILLQEFRRLREGSILPEEIKKAKNHIKGMMSLQLEDVHDFANYLALQMLLKNRIENPHQYWENIKKVTTSNIQVTMKSILHPSALNLAIISPTFSRTKIKKLFQLF